MAAAEDLCRGLVCSMLLFWCIVNTIAVAIRDQAISIAVESFAAMGNQQPSGQRSVSGNDISELASGLSQLAMALQSQNQAQPKAKAMPKAKVAAQPPVPPPGTTIRRRKPKGKKEEASLLSLLSLLFLLVLELSLLSTHLAMGSSRTSFCDNAASASKLPIGGRAFVSMSGAE